MTTLKTRLAKFNGLVRGSWLAITGDRDVLTRAGELVASLVVLPLAFVGVVVLGR
jgi:hypothetical protein